MARFWRGISFILIIGVGVSLLWQGAGLFPLSLSSATNERAAGAPSMSSPSMSSMQMVWPQVSNQQIERDRLIQHVDALSTVRHSERERAAIRQYLVEQLEGWGWTVEQQSFESRLENAQLHGVNLVATIAGNDPAARAVVLGAHYDTVAGSPGADDNASAVAVVLELARLLADVPTSRPVEIVLFDLEEAGLLGSTAFVDELGRSPNVEGAVILEMLGYACYIPGCQSYPSVLPIDPPSDTGDFLAVVGDVGHPFIVDAFRRGTMALKAQTVPNVPETFTLQVPTLGRLTPDLFRSDHVPFWRRGIGAVMVTDTANFRNPNYHQSSDRPETLDVDFLTGAATVTLEAIARLL
jgi:hypothetical protein